MDLKQLLLSASGRIGRQTYWMSVIGVSVAALLLEAIGWFVAQPTVYSDGSIRFNVEGLPALAIFAIVILLLLLTVIGLLLAIKRCHDRDRSGWFVLVALIPVIGGVWLLVELGFLRGTVGPNRYGPDPVPGYRLAV